MRQSSGFAWKIQATAPSAISRRLMMREHGEITPESVAAWRDEMAARRLERATIRQRIAAVRAFAAWAARTGALPAELGVALSAVESPRRAGQHAPLALHEPQLRLMDRAAGAAWTDDPYKHGHLAERTHDYYAQDRDGNVWYLGEDTATLKPNGQIESREGTFRAGRDGAQGGIFMPAHPKPGDGGWQEYYVGHAQDRYKILDKHTKVRTPAVSSHRAMLIRETTPLEPGVVDHKIYVRGIGTVLEETVKGGHERFQLVSVRHR